MNVIDFDAVNIGDRVTFQTRDNGFGGSGGFIDRHVRLAATAEQMSKWERTAHSYVTHDWTLLIERVGNQWVLKDRGRPIKSFNSPEEAIVWEDLWAAGKVLP